MGLAEDNVLPQAAILGLSINGSLHNEVAEVNGERSVSTSTAEEEAAAKPTATQNGHASRQPETHVKGMCTTPAAATQVKYVAVLPDSCPSHTHLLADSCSGYLPSLPNMRICEGSVHSMYSVAQGSKQREELSTSPVAWHAGSGVDAKTAARLRELEAQKAAAVRDEDYDEAKRLKLAIDGLRKLTSQLAELEARSILLLDTAHLMYVMNTTQLRTPLRMPHYIHALDSFCGYTKGP